MNIVCRKLTRKRLAICIFLILFALPAFGQPTDKEKLAQAHKSHNEAIALTEKNTADAYRVAFTKYQFANRIYKELGENHLLARSFEGMGFTSSALGRISEALDFYNKAIPLFQEASDKLREARTLNSIGRIYDDLGDPDTAIEYLRKALPLRREAQDLNGEAVTLSAIGAVFANIGENERALLFYTEALKLRNFSFSGNDKNNINGRARILNNIGRTYDILGEKQKALDYYNRSLPLRRTVDDKKGEAIVLNNIGLIYQELGDNQKALEYYDKSIAIAESIGNETVKATALNGKGNLYTELGKHLKALEFFQTALEINQRVKNKSGEITVLNNIGIIYAQTGDNQKAIQYYNDVLPMTRATIMRSTEAIALHNLMLSWQIEKNNQLAIFYGKQSVNKYQELRLAIRKLDNETQKTYLKTIEHTYRQLADLLIESGYFAQAEQVLRMLKEEEYFDFVRRDFDEIKTLDQRVSLNEKERKLIERYSKLADKVTEIGQEFATLEEKKRKQAISDEEQKRYEELEKHLADANAAFKLFLEKELVIEFSKTSKEGIEYDRNLQAKLKKWGKGTVTLYTVVTENRYRVILTTPNIQVDGKTEISAVELNKKIFAYRDALQDITADPRPLGKELYDILIKPIEKDLQKAKAKTLVWSLDGTLRYIPISTLSPDGKSYLVEKYQNVITTPRTRNDLSDSDTEWRALGVGVSEKQTVTSPDDPNEELDFSPIPGTKEELMTIVKDEETPNEKGILSGRRFLDKDFTINSLMESLGTKTETGKRKFTAVHIASHFKLGTNWSNSFLLLGNGKILTLKELKNSTKFDFGDVELVTLSACDTAFTTDSNGKEVDSLAEVIQAKSGKAVLAALWAVVDESTPLLMSEFYRLRKENPKMTKAEAMQRVQKGFVTGELKPGDEYIKKLDDYYKALNAADKTFKFDKDAPFAHPYFWSPFVLIGNWR